HPASCAPPPLRAALPIYRCDVCDHVLLAQAWSIAGVDHPATVARARQDFCNQTPEVLRSRKIGFVRVVTASDETTRADSGHTARSEEHTSELQSPDQLVC